MKKWTLLVGLILAIGCKSKNVCTDYNDKKTKQPSVAKNAQGDLIGNGREADLFVAPFRSWFMPAYEQYKPDPGTIEQLKGLTNGISVKIFMGTWCEDSQNQVPKFYRILREAGFERDVVTLIFVDRDKTTPEKLEAGLNITNVPTFIFYKTSVPGGKKGPKGNPTTKELNRIVESPIETLEGDMLRILTNQTYKHRYAD